MPAGHILFLHAEYSAPLAAAMRDGLKKGLGGKLQLDEMGPDQLPGNLALISGPAILDAAIKQHGDAAAIVSAIGIPGDSAAQVPATIPPLYILNWQNQTLYEAILQHPRCRGGMFFVRTATGPSFQEVWPGPVSVAPP